jgi:hypothetical protein
MLNDGKIVQCQISDAALDELAVEPQEVVHSVLRESLVFGDFRVPGQGRMDNLLKAHN